jgi:hypothetical protein
MQLIAPDILAEARGLSPVLSALGLFLGLMLLLFGWRAHRFWIVLLTTVVAGIYGLTRAPVYGSQPLVSAILLATAAGMLALAMARVVAFVAGGVAALLLWQAVASAREPLVCFSVGGLLGLVLFRVWTMLLTSLGGSLLIGYSALCLADRLDKLNAVDWSEKQTLFLNWACSGVAVAGLVIQFLLERRRTRKQPEAVLAPPVEPARTVPPAPPPAVRSRLLLLAGKVFRRAG